MNCDSFRDRLSPYLEGELQEEEREQTEHHLRTCPSCARDLTHLKEVVKMLRSVAAPAPPPYIADRIRLELGRQRQSRRAIMIRQWSLGLAGALGFLIIAIAQPWVPILSRRVGAPQVVAPLESRAMLIPGLHFRAERRVPGPKAPAASGFSSRASAERSGGQAEKRARLIPVPPATSRLPIYRPTTPSVAAEKKALSLEREEVPEEEEAVSVAEAPASPVSPLPAASPEKTEEESKGHQMAVERGEAPEGTPRVAPLLRAVPTPATPSPPQSVLALAPDAEQRGAGAASPLTAPMRVGWFEWVRTEPIRVGSPGVYVLSFVPVEPGPVRVRALPEQGLDVLNLPSYGRSEDADGPVAFGGPVSRQRPGRVTLIVTANQPGARRVRLTVQKDDAVRESWWLIVPIIEASGPSPERSFTFQGERWTFMDLAVHFSWQSRRPILFPAVCSDLRLAPQLGQGSHREVLAQIRSLLGLEWDEQGGGLRLYPSKPALQKQAPMATPSSR